jgi:hypothetical protein
MTSPTTLSSQPASSSLAIMRGSTVSDEVVANTIRSSSQMYRMNLNRLNPHQCAIGQSTPNTKIRQVR